ncbi:endopeptidase La [Candidatus Nesciobacter abundans]|uniref:Lon protease n=1 Tax=Candidatus Nesciobacter abundans TaxID=2601668 RepID=A0A5C0UGA6_9PROT|nr:endopeptidase La [Candidatus Nesciobacter abundans]QEK39098.1 endopeptidase La [Candidatus Nesciobacter abundans]
MTLEEKNSEIHLDKSERSIAVIPLKNSVMIPGSVLPIFIGRKISAKAIEYKKGKEVVFLTQKDPLVESPTFDDLYKIGTLGEIAYVFELSDGTLKIFVEGKKRVKIKKELKTDPFLEATFEILQEEKNEFKSESISIRSLIKSFGQYLKIVGQYPSDLLVSISSMSDAGRISDIITENTFLKLHQKQEILEELNLEKRVNLINQLIESEIEAVELEDKIRKRIKKQVAKTQRDYILQEQIKAIQKELNSGEENEISNYKKKIKTLKLSKEAKEKLNQEIKKLSTMSPLSSEASIVRNYLEVVLELPWNKKQKLNESFRKAKKILDNNHYGLEKIKEIIFELLALQKRSKSVKNSVLCFLGPPGVGKTSLAKNIAEAMGRSFVRIPLGGVQDEAEIRGHRRTYVGAMPGKIIQGLKKANFSNPLVLLDEIGSINYSYRGDPASALLEVLDPEQNSHFQDHYLELEYDLSDCMFIATANELNLPPALLDRLDVINLSGYTEQEKVKIAEKHLIPKQKELHHLKNDEITFSEGSIEEVIRKHTREAGVRNLDREIAKISRKVLKKIESESINSIEIHKENVKDFCGIEKYSSDAAELVDRTGVTTGMGWTPMGGDIMYVEATIYKGSGKIVTTGKLGDVMKESIQIALSLLKSKAEEFKIDQDLLKNSDIHVHFPEGAISKDGPSAGITTCCSILSALTSKKIKSNLAMTGEISLRGRLLKIGGVREKVLAAHRSGIRNIILPEENKCSVEEIPENVRKTLNIMLCDKVEEVLEYAIV